MVVIEVLAAGGMNDLGWVNGRADGITFEIGQARKFATMADACAWAEDLGCEAEARRFRDRYTVLRALDLDSTYTEDVIRANTPKEGTR